MAKTSTQPFIVSFGAENFFLDRDLARGLAWKDRTVVEVDGDDVSDTELVSICETRGIDDRARVVVLDNAQKVKGDKALKAYIAAREPTDTSVVLVAIVRAEKLPDIWAQAAKKGRLYEHRKLKTYESNNEVVKWLSAEAMRLEMGLEKGAPELLCAVIGNDLYKLSSELRKLQILVGKGNKATITQIKSVFSPSPTAEPYQVAGAATEKDVLRAMNFLSIVYRTMGEEAHVPLTFALIKQVEKLVVARHLVDSQATEDEIAAAIGMHPWVCKTQFLPHVRKHTVGSLIARMGELCKLDAEVKGAATSKRTRVELAVLALAQ